MSTETILVIVALILAVLSFLPQNKYPTLAVAVIVLCIALLI